MFLRFLPVYLVIGFAFCYLLAYLVGRFESEEVTSRLEGFITGRYHWASERLSAEAIGGYWWLIFLGGLAWPITLLIMIGIAIVLSLTAVANIPVKREIKDILHKHRAVAITSPNADIRELAKKYLKKEDQE